MARVGAMRGLEELTLMGNAATDRTLSYLEGSAMLRDLYVDSDRVGDRGRAQCPRVHTHPARGHRQTKKLHGHGPYDRITTKQPKPA